MHPLRSHPTILVLIGSVAVFAASCHVFEDTSEHPFNSVLIDDMGDTARPPGDTTTTRPPPDLLPPEDADGGGKDTARPPGDSTAPPDGVEVDVPGLCGGFVCPGLCCEEVCITDFLDNHQFCGSCDNDCTINDAVCVKGVCEPLCGERVCSPFETCGMTNEGEACVCGEDSACDVQGGIQCCFDESGLVPTCVDTLSSPQTCGDCETVCDGDSTACCDGQCVDTKVSTKHCGDCFNDCQSHPNVAIGACDGFGGCDYECAEGFLDCHGDLGCESSASENSSCGGCDTLCPAESYCAAPGTCCANREVLCGDVCADFNEDSNHCGGCGIACPDGQHCEGGRCECNTQGTFRCSDDPGAVCKALNQPAECGFDCGSAVYCGDTAGCVTSNLYGPAGTVLVANVCDCNSGQDPCLPGERCEGGSCVCGGAGNPGCDATHTTCCQDPMTGGSSCVNFFDDPMNCGGCGVQCPSGQCEDATCL